MAQLPDKHFLEALKEKYDLTEVVEPFVGQMRDMGHGDYLCCCPFKEENTPSFRVNKSRFHCFGCHARGDIFDWVVKTTGKTFPQAVKMLSGGEVPVGAVVESKRKEPPTHTPYDSELVAAILEVNRAAWYYFQLGVQDDHALGYICGRFSDQELDDFSIGYAPPERQGLFNYLSGMKYEPELLIKAGLISQGQDGSYYDRLRDRITIPLYNRTGDILGYVGRIIPRKGNEKLPKYVNPPTTWAFEKRRYLFNSQHFDPALKYAILVEGPVDAIKLTSIGIKNVMAIMGSDLTKQQVLMLENLTPRIFMLLDGDMPGLEATFKATQFMHSMNSSIFCILLGDGMDPDSWVASLPDPRPPSPLKALPIVKASDFYRNRVVIKDMKPEYDKSLLDELIKPYVDDNVRAGFPHYNVVDWVMQAYPEFAAEIKEKTLAMLADHTVESDGRLKLNEGGVKEFIKAWIKPSREVRKKHANQFKR